MWSIPAAWKQYNKMAVLHFFLVNSPLYIFYSLWCHRIEGCTTGFQWYFCWTKFVKSINNPQTPNHSFLVRHGKLVSYTTKYSTTVIHCLLDLLSLSFNFINIVIYVYVCNYCVQVEKIGQQVYESTYQLIKQTFSLLSSTPAPIVLQLLYITKQIFD